MASQRFQEDVAGTLEFYPPKLEVPTSAAVTLYKPGGATLQASAAGTVDSVSTTVAAAVARGARSFTVASATGIVEGRKYLLECAGRLDQVEVLRLDGTTVYTVGKVPFALTTSATLKGWRCSYALTTTHTADKDRNYRAAWAVVIATVTYNWDDLFDVVGAVDYYPTTLQYLLGAYPWIGDKLSAHQLDGETLLRTAWETDLSELMWGKGLDLARVKDKHALRSLHCAIVRRNVLRNLSDIDTDKIEAAERAERDLAVKLEAAVGTRLHWYDENDDEQVQAGEVRPDKAGIHLSR